MLKRISMIALAATLTLSASARQIVRIVVASDPHLLSPDLMAEGSRELKKAARSDMKLTALSDEILSTWVEQVKELRPDVVMLSGDLTHNGELASHQRMASYLDQLRECGITTLVIPGNHDISNPYARQYAANGAIEAPTVTRRDFVEIYAAHGYGKKVKHDANSLSYVCEPVEGLVVIGIDSNLDEQNRLISRGDGGDSYHNGGSVKPATLEWLAQEARRARQRGKTVVAMMHHHAVEHFDGERRVLPKYVLDNAAELRQTLMDAGVELLFTGHLHINDIAREFGTNPGDSITEVATGSLVTYPFAYRVVEIEGNEARIDTRRIEATPSEPQLAQRGKEQMKKVAPALTAAMMKKLLKEHEGKLKKLGHLAGVFSDDAPDLVNELSRLPDLLSENFSDVSSAALIAFAEGNERKADADRIIDDLRERTLAIAKLLPQGTGRHLAQFAIEEVITVLDPKFRSLLEDKNHCGTPNERRVNDLNLSLKLAGKKK